MRITIKTGSSEFVLCGGEVDSQFPSSFRINGQELVQKAQFLRAVTGKTFGRGNVDTTVTFRVEREHVDHKTALAFAATHCFGIHVSIVAAYTVKFVFQSNGQIVYYLTDSRLVSWPCDEITGCWTKHDYSVTGGRFEGGV